MDSFITCLNVRILHNCRHKCFGWTLLKLFVCLSKLPGGTKDKGSKRVLLIRGKQGKKPELANFIDFVNDENLIVSDPVFSRLWNSTLTRKQNQEGLQHTYQDQRENLVIHLWDHHVQTGEKIIKWMIAWSSWTWLWRKESTSGFRIWKSRTCDNRTSPHEIRRLQTCEKLHATHQVGVWWRAIIISFRIL